LVADGAKVSAQISQSRASVNDGDAVHIGEGDLQTGGVAAELLKTGIADGDGSPRTINLEFHRIVFFEGKNSKQIPPAGNATKPSCKAVGRYLLNNFFFAAASSLSLSSPTLGYSKSRSARVSMTAPATTTRVNNLLYACTTYQGASFVAVSWIISSYAFMYSSQKSRSLASLDENFQFFSGSSIRSRNRRFCSFFETCRKNFRTTTPLLARYCSKLRMSSKRSSQIFLPTSCGGSFCFAKNSGWTRTTSTSS